MITRKHEELNYQLSCFAESRPAQPGRALRSAGS